MASRADLIRLAKERLKAAQALHDFVHQPTAKGGPAGGRPSLDSPDARRAAEEEVEAADRRRHEAQQHPRHMPRGQQLLADATPGRALGAHQGGTPAGAIRPKPEAARAQQVERTYGPGAGDRRTARAEFAREHGEANADYRTWSPAHVAAAKRAGLFGGTVPASADAMPGLLRAARGQAAERGQLLPHAGLGAASQGAAGRPSGAEIVRALEQRLAGMTPAVQITRRRRPPIRLS